MQNIINYLNLSLYNGKSIVNSRVYFVKKETTALTFSQLSGLDSADFISVYENVPFHSIQKEYGTTQEGSSRSLMKAATSR